VKERNIKRRYSADFETVTWKEGETSVWCWAVCEIGDVNNTSWGTDIESFMTWCKNADNGIVYFHNLKFDGEFILHYLLTHDFRCNNGNTGNPGKTFKTLISDMGVFFEIKIYFTKSKHITIYDSFKLIPTKVEKIPEGFGLSIQKLDLDYDKEREPGYIPNDDELAYILNDVKIPALALEKLFEIKLTKMTLAGNAMTHYREGIGRRTFEHFYPVLKFEIDQEIRRAYRGGFTYLNPIYANKRVNSGCVLDVNSLYPSVLYDKKLPICTPKFFNGKYEPDPIYDLYVQTITCMFELKPGKIPTIQIKDDPRFRPTDYLTSSNGHTVCLTLTNIDLKLFFENYDVEGLRYLNGFKFRSISGLFEKYIDKWMGLKIESKKNNNKAYYTIAKLMLNSLYGKFGLNPKCRSKSPYLHDGIVKYKLDDEEIRDGIYIPMAVFVTSYAREKTIRTSQAIRDYSLEKYGEDKYLYSDTDSCHTTLTGEELSTICDIDDYRLGAWKKENEFRRAKFIRAKTYVEEIWDDDHIKYELKITCAGLPENCYNQVTFDNFEDGLQVTGKLTYKHVIGGVKLVETPWSIKKGNLIARFKW